MIIKDFNALPNLAPRQLINWICRINLLVDANPVRKLEAN